MANNKLQAGRKTITDVPQKITDNAEEKIAVIMTNLSGLENESGVTPTPVIVFIDGDNSVSPSNGFPVHPGSTMAIEISGYTQDNDIWAVCAIGQTAELAIMYEQGEV